MNFINFVSTAILIENNQSWAFDTKKSFYEKKFTRTWNPKSLT